MRTRLLGRLVVGAAMIATAGLARAQGVEIEDHSRPEPSVMCRVSGTDARGARRTVLIRVDGQRAWSVVEEVVLTECRAGYRLSNCVIVGCN
jgi:hypothetical protein